MIFAAECRPEPFRLAVKGMLIFLLSMLLAALLTDLDPDGEEPEPLLTSREAPRLEGNDEEHMPPACQFAAHAGEAGMVRIPVRVPVCHGA
jgi:hypothetical protein